MKRIALYANEQKDKDYGFTSQIAAFLQANGCLCLPDPDCCAALHIEYDGRFGDCEFAIVIGGDGTILKAAQFFRKYRLPIVGVNLGTKGFLADIEKYNYAEKLIKILNGEYGLEKRIMLRVYSNEHIYADALNEVVFKNKSDAGAGRYRVYTNETLFADYIADGILIGAPTGSTAYSLSLGGPIVKPTCELILIQAIYPHSLYARCYVTDANDIITVQFDPQKTNIMIDGSYIDSCSNEISVRRSAETIDFIRLHDYDFCKVLYEKIK